MRIAKFRSGFELHTEMMRDIQRFESLINKLNREEIFDLIMILQYLSLKCRKKKNVYQIDFQWWSMRHRASLDSISEVDFLQIKEQLGLESFVKQQNFAFQMLDDFSRKN